MKLKRTIANLALRALGYEGAAGGRRWKGASELVSPPASALMARAPLMRRARGAAANQPFAASIISAWTSALVGSGIKPISKAPNAKEIDAAFARWVDRADYDQLTDFYGLQTQLARSMVLTGDGFGAFESGDNGELQLRLISSEQVATISSELALGRWIVDGVEFDADLRRVAVHLFKTPPGLPMPNPSLQTLRIALDDCIHVFRPDHIGQVRGVSWLAPVLTRLNDLDATSDALVVRAKTSAQFVGFVIGDDGSLLTPDASGDIAMEPGAMVRLKPGESVEFASPPQLGQETPLFMKALVREVAAGCGVPYEVLASDLSDANFSSLRGSMTEFRRRVEQVQYGVLVPALRKVYRSWLAREILGGRIEAAGFENDPEAWLAHDWLTPKFAPVDPLKDSQAEILQISAGLKSRREAVAERGLDLIELDATIASDNASASALGLKFTTSTAAPKTETVE